MKFTWRVGAMSAVVLLAGWSLQRLQAATPVLAQEGDHGNGHGESRGNGHGEDRGNGHGEDRGHGNGHAYGRGNGHSGDQADEREGRDHGEQGDRDEESRRGQGRMDRRRGSIVSVFDPRSRNVISDYYHGRGRGLPPGLAKRNGDLPPGLERQLERNGTLPPGLQREVQPFPTSLTRRLPRMPSYYRRGTLGNDAVIYDTRTQRIVDVIHAVLGR